MQQFKNWRWYKCLGGDSIADLGSHQVDIYNWFLEANPSNVTASGRTDYYETFLGNEGTLNISEHNSPLGRNIP